MSRRRDHEWWRDPESDEHDEQSCRGFACPCTMTSQQFVAEAEHLGELLGVEFDGRYTSESR